MLRIGPLSMFGEGNPRLETRVPALQNPQKKTLGPNLKILFAFTPTEMYE